MKRRVIIVAALALLSVSLWAPDVRRAFGDPTGLGTPAMTPVRASAGAAGLLRYVDLGSSSVPQRLRWLRNGACWTLHVGERCDLFFNVDGRPIHYSLLSQAPPPLTDVVLRLRFLLALLWLISAAAFLLLRPSAATWFFFVLSLYGWSPNNVFTMLGPPWLQSITTTFEDIWEVCIPLAAPLFALYLLRPPNAGRWRILAERCIYGLAAVAALAEIAFVYLAVIRAYDPAIVLHQAFDEAVILLALVLTNAFLIATYAGSEKIARERVRWVLAGSLCGSAALVMIYTPWRTSYVLYSTFQAIYVFAITASTGYAVLRHRIIDVNVVVSRTVVYTLLSALVVGLFALVDLFFSKALSENRAGLMADVGLALILGFFMNTLHRRLDRFVDGILFRQRHMAEKHVALVASSLRHVAHDEAVQHLLVDEPLRSFDLLFGVLARFDGTALEVAYASDDAIPRGTALGDAEALMAYLAAQRKALTLREHFWSASALRVNGVDPAVAIPVFSHGDLTAVAFFAPHRNGTELDGDEIALIENVADAAGAAYDRLEAKSLRDLLQKSESALQPV